MDNQNWTLNIFHAFFIIKMVTH